MNANAMQILDLYQYANCWVFDAPEHDLCKEPFVMGASDIISHFLPEGTTRATLLFSDGPFPDAHRIDKEMKTGGGYWYGMDGMAGWLCPATLCYFNEFPESIYFTVEATGSGSSGVYEYLMETICDLLENGDVAMDFESEPAQAQTIRILAKIVRGELEGIRARAWMFDYYDEDGYSLHSKDNPYDDEDWLAEQRAMSELDGEEE